ncbi:ATP-binding protein [Streptomyces sp. NPDC002825]|uniref:sensor histidine kinase n=1 Tax=Streptomyces sp. NPDC002825 TaxID=3154666 RepID=UPI00332ADB9C
MAGVLLLECAMLHALRSGDGPHATAEQRAEAVVQALGRAIRACTLADGPAATDTRQNRQERRRIAREMHDELGTSLSLALRHMEARTPGTRESDIHLVAAERSLREAIGHTHRLVGDLRAETGVPPLGEAIRAFVDAAAPASVTVSLAATGDEQRLPDTLRRELFLVVRECLRNSLGHAEPRQIKVTSRVTRWWAHVRVEDDGIGFGTADLSSPAHGHHGLRGMTERITEIGGRLTLAGTPGEGTRVDVHVPLRERAW